MLRHHIKIVMKLHLNGMSKPTPEVLTELEMYDLPYLINLGMIRKGSKDNHHYIPKTHIIAKTLKHQIDILSELL